MTPRLSRLDDGRLVVIVDQDDRGHFHEEQPPGILAFWSVDDGATWSQEEHTGIAGFEPDRILDLPDGRLAVASQVVFWESQEMGEILSCSDDGGKTWYRKSVIAHNGYHRICEEAIVILDGGSELACVEEALDYRSAPQSGHLEFAQLREQVGKHAYGQPSLRHRASGEHRGHPKARGAEERAAFGSDHA